VEPLIVFVTLLGVIVLYFRYNPLGHTQGFMWRRFLNWFPLGMSYAFLYMARYNLNVASNALGTKMSIASFGTIFAAGTVTYGLSFLINGPLVDQIGGKRGIILACFGAALCNTAMGIAVWLLMNDKLTMDMTLILSLLYAGNMFFQSYGAVSIIKNKAYWFHVRERGIFGAIFGTLISVGIYFAFDWNGKIADAAKAQPKDDGGLSYIFKHILGTGTNGIDAVWLVFFIPSAILIVWLFLNLILVKDTPSLAGHEDFDTHDASSGKMHVEHTKTDMLKAIFTHPVIMLVAFIEFTNGVVRNGIVQWYHKFAHAVPQMGAEYIADHWGFLLCITGIVGGFSTGYISDKVFQSRRGPPVAIAAGLCAVLAGIMFFNILSWPLAVGICAVIIGLLAVSIHGMMSGTAAADFGGRKMTATASGITDGFVYLGSGLQSFVLGQLIVKENPDTWAYWPAFIIPFSMLSIVLAARMWTSLPEATKRHFAERKAAKA
jgi:MFS transporter, OPA family, glycerol-3-phosphate transporter